jgi:hypothetical protein
MPIRSTLTLGERSLTPEKPLLTVRLSWNNYGVPLSPVLCGAQTWPPAGPHPDGMTTRRSKTNGCGFCAAEAKGRSQIDPNLSPLTDKQPLPTPTSADLLSPSPRVGLSRKQLANPHTTRRVAGTEQARSTQYGGSVSPILVRVFRATSFRSPRAEVRARACLLGS